MMQKVDVLDTKMVRILYAELITMETEDDQPKETSLTQVQDLRLFLT